MHKTEYQDYLEAINRAGYSKDDFEIFEKDMSANVPNTIYPKKGEVTVNNKKTHKQKTYKSDSGTHWVVDFEDDLKQGYFN